MCIEHKKNKIAELKEKLKQAEEKAELELEEGGGGVGVGWSRNPTPTYLKSKTTEKNIFFSTLDLKHEKASPF